MTEWVSKSEVVGNHSHSLVFELGVVKIDTEVINGGVLGLEGGFKANFIGFETLDFYNEDFNSVFLKSVFFLKSGS